MTNKSKAHFRDGATIGSLGSRPQLSSPTRWRRAREPFGRGPMDARWWTCWRLHTGWPLLVLLVGAHPCTQTGAMFSYIAPATALLLSRRSSRAAGHTADSGRMPDPVRGAAGELARPVYPMKATEAGREGAASQSGLSPSSGKNRRAKASKIAHSTTSGKPPCEGIPNHAFALIGKTAVQSMKISPIVHSPSSEGRRAPGRWPFATDSP